MLKAMTYIYPHNTLSVIDRGNGIINRVKYFIGDIYYVFKLSLLMLLIGAMMVGGLFIAVGLPYMAASLFL